MWKHEGRITLRRQRILRSGTLMLSVLVVQVSERVIQQRINAHFIYRQSARWTVLDRVFNDLYGRLPLADRQVIKCKLKHCIRLAREQMTKLTGADASFCRVTRGPADLVLFAQRQVIDRL